jgi:hypothetical protein
VSTGVSNCPTVGGGGVIVPTGVLNLHDWGVGGHCSCGVLILHDRESLFLWRYTTCLTRDDISARMS